MSKRFVDTARYRQAWRKLDPKLRAAYYWLTENSDAAGFWKIDLDHFRFECGYALDVDRLIKETGAAKKCGDVIQLVDFIEVNYGTIKEGYNPHKPALRALARHQVSSLNQASTKLEEEDEDEDEDYSGKKERAKEKPIVAKVEDIRFETLWANYGRIGSKPEAMRYWQALTEPDRMAIEAKLPAYVASTPGGAYRKHLQGWINPKNRLWESAIVTTIPTTNGQSSEQQRAANYERILAERYPNG